MKIYPYIIFISLFLSCTSDKKSHSSTISNNNKVNQLTISDSVIIEEPIICVDSSIIDTFYGPSDGLAGSKLIINEDSTFESKYWNDIGPFTITRGIIKTNIDTLFLYSSINEIYKSYNFTSILEKERLDEVDTLFISYKELTAEIYKVVDYYDGEQNKLIDAARMYFSRGKQKTPHKVGPNK